MPKVKRKKSAPTKRHNPIKPLLFTKADDQRLIAAYNAVKPSGGERVRWSEVTKQYRKLLQAECKKDGSPKHGANILKTYRDRKRLRIRYINHLAPGICFDYDKHPGSNDSRILQRCINAVVADDAKSSHSYSAISKQWKNLYPMRYLSESGVRGFIRSLERYNLIKREEDGTYTILERSSASAANTSAVVTYTSHEPTVLTPLPLEAADEPHPVDAEILDYLLEPTETEKLQQTLDSTTAELKLIKSQLAQAKADLAKERQAIQARQAQLQEHESTLYQWQDALHGQHTQQVRLANLLSREDKAVRARQDKLKTETATVKARLKAIKQRLQLKHQDLGRREADLGIREADLARREAAINIAEQRQLTSEATHQAASAWFLGR